MRNVHVHAGSSCVYVFVRQKLQGKDIQLLNYEGLINIDDFQPSHRAAQRVVGVDPGLLYRREAAPQLTETAAIGRLCHQCSRNQACHHIVAA